MASRDVADFGDLGERCTQFGTQSGWRSIRVAVYHDTTVWRLTDDRRSP
jgi:hypothetical protein